MHSLFSKITLTLLLASSAMAEQTDATSVPASSSNFLKVGEDGYRTLVDKDRTKIGMRNDVTIALLKFKNANYGAGSQDLKTSSIRRDHPAWQELAATSSVRFDQGLKNDSTLYGRVSAVAGYTMGHGDAASPSTTSNRPFLLDSEEAVLGWRSGKLFATEDVIDISVGNQKFAIGDKFVISDGTSDAYRRAAFFLGPRRAYRQTAIVKINTRPVRGKLFHLRTNTNQKRMLGTDQPKTYMYGGDVEYVYYDPKDPKTEIWNVGLLAMYMYKSDRKFEGTTRNRHGLQIFNPRLGGYFFPFNRDIRFYAGFVHQKNNNTNRKVNANAYYVEPGYRFSQLWGQPLVTYRYMFFSGDSGAKPDIKKSYDPINFGYWARDGYGTWECGQIHGTFYFTNTNQEVHNVHLHVTPNDQHSFGAQYYHIHFVKPAQAGSIASRAGDEFDIYWDWKPYKWLALNFMAGMNTPKRGVKELTIAANPTVPASKINKTTYFGQVSATFTF